jgi:hypothetical protein
MNTVRLLVIGAFLTSVVALGVLEGPTTAHPSVGSGDGRMATTAVASAEPVAFWAITWDTFGSFDSMPAAVDRFTKETCNQSVEARLQSAPEAIIILREDPRGKAQFHYAVGLRVRSAVQVSAPLKVEEVRLPEAVTVAHTGPYEELQSVYESLENSAGASNVPRWPVILTLDNDPRRVSPREIKTRLTAPF